MIRGSGGITTIFEDDPPSLRSFGATRDEDEEDGRNGLCTAAEFGFGQAQVIASLHYPS